VHTAEFNCVPTWRATQEQSCDSQPSHKASDKDGATEAVEQSRESRVAICSREVWVLPLSNREVGTPLKGRRVGCAICCHWSWNSRDTLDPQLGVAAPRTRVCILGSGGQPRRSGVAGCSCLDHCTWGFCWFCCIKFCIQPAEIEMNFLIL